jgi:4-aminobutyrate aminotransferase-like enzyme
VFVVKLPPPLVFSAADADALATAIEHVVQAATPAR